jgi:di/tricarboxylate transporter
VFCLLLVIGLMALGPDAERPGGARRLPADGPVPLHRPGRRHRVIHWRSLILIVGMLPFSLALQRTGGIDLAADALVDLVGDYRLRPVLACLFALTALIGLKVSNTATAVLMAPVALALARHLDTPISSPVNALVSTAGNYGFGDFVKVGLPLTAMVLLLSVGLVPWLLPP